MPSPDKNQLDAIKAMLNDSDLSVVGIAEAVGIGKSYVNKFAAENQIDLKKRADDIAERKRLAKLKLIASILALRNQGVGIQNIATQLQTSRKFVEWALEKNGVYRKKNKSVKSKISVDVLLEQRARKIANTPPEPPKKPRARIPDQAARLRRQQSQMLKSQGSV